MLSVNQELISMLERHLRMARTGEAVGGAIVLIDSEGGSLTSKAFVSGRTLQMIGAIDLLKQVLLSGMEFVDDKENHSIRPVA